MIQVRSSQCSSQEHPNHYLFTRLAPTPVIQPLRCRRLQPLRRRVLRWRGCATAARTTPVGLRLAKCKPATPGAALARAGQAGPVRAPSRPRVGDGGGPVRGIVGDEAPAGQGRRGVAAGICQG